jgi:hypothetical protein
VRRLHTAAQRAAVPCRLWRDRPTVARGARRRGAVGRLYPRRSTSPAAVGHEPAGPRLTSYRSRRKPPVAESSKVACKGHIPRPQGSPLGLESPRLQVPRRGRPANLTPRNQPASVAASELALRKRPGRTRPPELLRVLVAHKSFNPGGHAPGASDFFSSLSGPTESGEVGGLSVVSSQWSVVSGQWSVVGSR